MQRSKAASPVTIRAAEATEAAAVKQLLRDSDLPLDGVPDDLADFFVATRGNDSALVGAIGLERYGDVALLRSAAVRAGERGTGVGDALVQRIVAYAREHGIGTLVLLTTTAELWFPRFGFQKIARSAAPQAVHASAEFRGACPDTATTMALELASASRSL
jgi:amino-acid N-acetyltransferase